MTQNNNVTVFNLKIASSYQNLFDKGHVMVFNYQSHLQRSRDYSDFCFNC